MKGIRKLAPLLVGFLTASLWGCSQAPVLQKEWATDLLYVGTYKNADISDGTTQDYYIHFAFPTGAELSAGISKEPEMSFDLAKEGKELSKDQKVGYIDVGKEYEDNKKEKLSDLIASGGMVECFLSVGPYSASNEAVSGRYMISSLGYTYTLSAFSVVGEKLTANRTKIYRQYRLGGTEQ